MRMKKFAWTLLALLALCLPALAGAEETSLVISEAMSRNPAIWQLDYQDYIEFYNYLLQYLHKKRSLSIILLSLAQDIILFQTYLYH